MVYTYIACLPTFVIGKMRTKLFIFLFIVVGIAHQAKSQIITTIAGTGIGLYSGNGGQATNAELHWPIGVYLDGVGNIYISDTENDCIRMINTAGIITTIAGGGTSGLGDGGQATLAILYNPFNIAFDEIGNMYIADCYHQRIRMINTAGIITTIAGIGTYGTSGDGGPATAAKLCYPQDIALDALGNLYIADGCYNSSRIRMVNTAGIITTIAGTSIPGYSGDGGPATNAQLYEPAEIAFDMKGNLYISDSGNNRIRMVNTAGIISTVVGTGVAGFSGDGGQATAAEIDNPYGLALDAIGNLYLADYENNRIRKVNTIGIISTIAGNGTAGFSGDGGLAILAELNNPTAVALDSSLCNLYIADANNNRIRMVSNAGAAMVVSSPTVCVGNTATLTASGAANYTWSPSTNLNTNLGGMVVATNTVSTTYTVISILNNCSNTATASVTVNPLPTVTVNSPTTICAGDTGTLTASGASTYTWSNGANASSILVNPSSSSTYTVTGMSAANCISQPTVAIVNIAPNPTVSISGNTTICIGQNTTLTASGATTYTWSTGDVASSVTFNPSITTGYTVTGGLSICNSTATTTITVNNPFSLTLPNIVTPNNDGINDFIDFGKYQFSSLQLDIYNRWGAKVYESTNPTCIWKPTEDDGTYFYTAQYQINCNSELQSKSLKGFITVIR